MGIPFPGIFVNLVVSLEERALHLLSTEQLIIYRYAFCGQLDFWLRNFWNFTQFINPKNADEIVMRRRKSAKARHEKNTESRSAQALAEVILEYFDVKIIFITQPGVLTSSRNRF